MNLVASCGCLVLRWSDLRPQEQHNPPPHQQTMAHIATGAPSAHPQKQGTASMSASKVPKPALCAAKADVRCVGLPPCGTIAIR